MLQGATTGWVVGVLVEEGEEVVRRFFAVTEPDRARAEWLAADAAQAFGPVAASPQGGHEPVETVGPLSPRAAAGLPRGGVEVRPLGPKWPRRWLT